MNLFCNLIFTILFLMINGNEVSSNHQKELKQSIDSVFEAQINEAFLLEKLTQLGSRNIEIKSTNLSDTTWQVYVSNEIKNTPPNLLKPFLNEWQKVSYTQLWHGKAGGPYNCTYELNLQQAGIEVFGETSISSINSNTIIETTIKYNSNIPLFGKSIANYAAKTGEQSIIDDFDYMEKHIPFH